MMRSALFLLYITLVPAVILCIGLTSRADDTYDIKVNDDAHEADQSSPRVAVNYAGEFVVVWEDKRNSRSEIYFQYFDSTGTPLEDNQPVGGISITAPQYDPAVNANQLGRFGSVWGDYRNGQYPFNPDIYYAAIDLNGPGDNSAVSLARADSTCESPDIAVLPDGDMIIVWADYRNKNWDIYAQRLDETGGLEGSNFKINSEDDDAQQHSPRVAGLSDGGFVVVWYDNRYGDDDIFGRRFDASAGPIAVDFKINDDNTGKRQAFPVVTADGYGRFYTAWVDWRNGTYPKNPDIYYRRYDAEGGPVGAAKKITDDSNSRPQKDVAICSDRMGNIGIVWADSSTGEWDATARVVDNLGDIAGGSFLIHQDRTGRQLQPDVATDGYKFFFVWADSRDGNFDIFVTIKEYNDPTIIADPKTLTFNMEEGGSTPGSKAVDLRNTGYGELSWRVSPHVDWLSVNPQSGTTPASFSVLVNTDTMAYGEYYGEIALIDLDHDDSSEAVTVILNVTAPLIDISPDTLNFKALAEMGNPAVQTIQVNNAGTGGLNWSAEETADWFAIDPASGSASDYVSVAVDISGMEYGTYMEPLVISSADAKNSPVTAWISLELVGNMPYLRATPDSINFEGGINGLLEGAIEISNPGSGTLDWTAVNSVDWLLLDKYNGSDYDTINVSIDNTLLSTGYYWTELFIYDSSSFNEAVTIPISLSLTSYDTIRFYNTNVMLGGIGVMPLYAELSEPAKAVYIPFSWDNTSAILDSIVPQTAVFPTYVDFYTAVEIDGSAEFGFRVNDSYISENDIPSGNYHAASLYFTAGETDCFNAVDTLSSDSSEVYIINSSFEKVLPAVISGQLVIGNPTSSDNRPESRLPESVVLSQNYPNPFNSSTTIEFSLPSKADVTVAVYNILGQTVYEFGGREYPAGRHRLIWEGRLSSSSIAPSGIYFYRLKAAGQALVKKMVLLK